MSQDQPINIHSLRAKKARFARHISKSLVRLMLYLAPMFFATGLAAVVLTKSWGYFVISAAIFMFMFAIWSKWDLPTLEPEGVDITGKLASDILAMLTAEDNNPQAVWKRLSKHWQSYFLTNHLFVQPQNIEALLDDKPESLRHALNKALEFAQKNNAAQIEPGALAAALIDGSASATEYLRQTKHGDQDVNAIAEWLVRFVNSSKRKKENFGGIARDWSFGFTNFLSRYAANVSLEIMKHGANFGWLTSSADVIAAENALAGNSVAVVLIGPQGIGKTSRVYALAQRMIEGKADKRLAYHQILELDVATIIANASRSGSLEQIFNRLIGEATSAGHVIMFMDDAALFFNEGTGSINAASILLPALQNHAGQYILTMTPEDFQRLKTNNSALASLLTPIILNELPEKDIMNILEDTVSGLEHRFNCLITYAAIKAAYRLSGRYDTEEAYPGKAIKLLERSISLAHDKIVDELSVEQAVEQTHGVKVSLAKPAEAQDLLNLEDKIHERMINQSEAVEAVASALRRARAGVANPKRPIGSFLFLGPTGVGKTELAKAVASVYFGSENNMIRLDMSEYQQESDVSRLLDTGTDANVSFLMSIRHQPFSVVLLDEIEKANPAILNLLLQLLDEGRLTDSSGRAASFIDAVIIATSNAGANAIRNRVSDGGSMEDFKEELTDQLINTGIFKPELLNRFDDVVLFRPLNREELALVVRLLLKEVNHTLANQNIKVELTDAAVQKIVALGTDERYGARPMRRALQRGVEDSVAQKILSGEAQPGNTLTLDEKDIQL